MQITLKQREIEAALRQFITNSGISLVGKTVDIGFTAGRKEGGLVADISIEDTSVDAEASAPIKPVSIVSAVAEVAGEAQSEAAPAAAAKDEADAPAGSLFG